MSSGTVVLTALLLALSIQTPARPDFSGTWILDAARSSAVGGGQGGGNGRGRVGGGGGLGLGPSADELTIAQTSTTLTIAERRGSATSRIVLTLYGTPSTRTIAAGRNSGGTATSTSTWKDRHLITVVVTPAEPGSRDTVRYTETRFLDGDSLVVEVTMSGSPNARRSVYARQRE
jgi:hypothetical protein